MPGTAMHHMIAERLKGLIDQKRGLGELSDEDYEKLQTLLANPLNQAYLFLGAQGPDFFFFNTRDWPPALDFIVNKVLALSDFIDGVKEDLLGLVPDPIIEVIDALGDAKDQVIQSSATLSWLEGTIGEMKQILEGLKASLQEAAKTYITDLINPFNQLSHPYRDGVRTKNILTGEWGNFDGEEWWYFDALHYRKTGQYAQALLNSSALDSPLHLYAIGHLTHVAADTVGHAYVNLNSGGPYRSHGQRHRVAENFQDVFNYHLYTNSALKDLGRSQIHALYNFKYAGIITPVGDENPLPPPDGVIPDELAEFIANTINSTHAVDESAPGGPDFGGALTADDVKVSFRLWYKFWRMTTESGTIPAPKPYSFSGEVADVYEQAMENAEGIADYLSDAADTAGSGGILGILAFLAALLIAAVAAALTLIDFILGMLTVITGAGIKYLISLVYEQVYAAYQYFRLGVALNGLALPLTESINEPVFNQFKDPSIQDSTFRSAATLKADMPLLRWHESATFATPEIHLTYPLKLQSADGAAKHGERNPAPVAPDSYLGKHSDWYAWGPLQTDSNVIDNLLEAYQNDPAQHEEIMQKLISGGVHEKNDAPLGNALTLTEDLYSRWLRGGRIPDFNLDSDRGYGYLAWKQPWDEDNTPDRIVVQPKDDGDVANAHDQIVRLQIVGKGGTT